MTLTVRTALALAVAFAAVACSDTEAPRPAASAGATQQEAVQRIGDITIRASVLPTATLSPEIADSYGLARDEGTLMLLVGVRQGPEAQERALPARITATVTHLSGQRQDVTLREVRSAAPDGSEPLLDYVGTVETSLPDQLRFDLTVVREDGGTSTMRFSREFFPR